MKKPEKIFMVVLVTILSTFCNLSSSEYESYDGDITMRREFGCRWYGGSSSSVTCNCMPEAEMTIKKNIPWYSTTEIVINNCKTVVIESNAIAEMRNLRSIRMNNIGSITFNEESIRWYGYRDLPNNYGERFDLSIPSIRIQVYNSNVTLISNHAFQGRINEILFERVLIERTLALAFANLLQTEKITIKDSVMKNIALQSFKGFSIKQLELNGVKADLIPSRAFSNVTVLEKVLIENCKFGTVHSGAFSIFNPQIFQVTNNNIEHLNGEAFKIVSRGLVEFKNNTFNTVDDGAFRGITLNTEEMVNNAVFSFESNTLSTITRNSLSVSDITPKFANIYLNQTCNCESIGHKIQETEYYGDIQCLHEGNYMVVKDFKSNMCSIITNYYITIIIVCVIIVLLAIVISGLVVYYKTVYRSKKYGSQKQTKSGNTSLIVPDGRTYKETELYVVVEKNDLLTTDL